MFQIKCFLRLALLLATSLSAHALCPDGSSFDNTLSACVTGSDAFGPFTNEMVKRCQAAGAGDSCTRTYPYLVKGHTANVQRWSRSFTTSLRGTASCPAGAVRSPSYGNHCYEQNSTGSNNVYGNFSLEDVARCESLGGGTACYTNRWSAEFYLRVQGTAVPPPSTVSNKFGAWLFYAEALGKTHTQLADQLKAQGVKRIYIKIADNAAACSLFPDACSKTTTDIYRARGIEPWAWAYNYPGNEAAQADALYQAARYGYVGFVTDIEVEFDRKSTELHTLFQAFQAARNRAKNDGLIAGSASNFALGATTWGNPTDHGMRVDIIDQYVDFHMPQTYLEVWGGSYMNEAARWIAAGNCEYRNLGASKPIWHIVSTEYDQISGAQLDSFMAAAGPNASIWRIPGGGTPTSIWNDWAQINWQRASFSEAECGNGNNLVKDYLGSSPTPVPTPVVPYWSQLANTYEPYATCSITSMAMITDFFGLTNASTLGKRTPDYLYERFGKRQDVPSLAQVFNTIAAEKGSALRDRGTTSGTFAQLRERASQGKPTIVHGWFTAAGHILVVTGYDGSYYTVNDPYGKWNGVAGAGAAYDTSVSGKGLKYAKANFEAAINDNGAGNDLWLHMFE